MGVPEGHADARRARGRPLHRRVQQRRRRHGPGRLSRQRHPGDRATVGVALAGRDRRRTPLVIRSLTLSPADRRGSSRVLHYLEHWLELSSGFVWEHVSRSRYRGVVVSHNAVEHRDAFPYRPVYRLDPLSRHVAPRRWPGVRTTALRAVAATHRAHVVHVHFGYVVGDVTEMARRSHTGVVLSLHGADATELPLRQPHHYDDVIEHVDAIIVPSHFLETVATGLGFPSERIHVIPAGIDTSFFTPTPLPPEPTVTFVGRLVEKKGLDILLQAWPDVARAVPGARLDILGAGPLAGAIPGGDGSVRHVPPQPQRRRDQVREAIRSARLVVSPSRTAANGDAESLLLVNLEAQASGRPVVSTRHGGIPEFVTADVSGLLVDEGDAGQLRDAMIRVLTDDALAHRLAGAGPALVERFDVAKCVARVDDVYDDVLRRLGSK